MYEQFADVAEYAYDTLGRRSMNAVYDDETYLYYYDAGWRELAELWIFGLA